jgi:hypothetical protein
MSQLTDFSKMLADMAKQWTAEHKARELRLRMQMLADNAETARIQARMRADRQRERHTRQLLLLILSAPLVITAMVALGVEIFK